MEHPIILILLMIQNFLMSWFVGGYIFRLSPNKKHIQFGLSGGLLVYIVRALIRFLNLPIGLNTLITLVLSITLYKFLFKIDNWKEPALISVLGYIMVIFIEILTLGFSLSLFDATPDIMLSNPTIHIIVSTLQNFWLFLFIMFLIGSHKLFKKCKEAKIGNK